MRDEPDLAAALEEFDRACAAPADPVPRYVAVGVLTTAGALLLGAVAAGDGGLLTGAGLVLACAPVAWLVGAARKV